MKLDVFISYSRKDSEIADQIFDCLNDNNISCFIDREDISGGEEFSPVIAEHIKSSTIFLFLGSKNSYESKWTSKELHFAISNKDSIAVIPYRIDDEPVPVKIELAIADLNIRNIKEHPFESILIEDIKNSMEKLAPKNGKEDIKMAKAIIDKINSSSHDKTYKIELLNRLGNFNYSSINLESRPKEAREYYNSCLGLLEKMDQNKYRSKNSKIAKICMELAKIEEELNNIEEAEKICVKAYENFIKTSDARLSQDQSLIDCLIFLSRIRVNLKRYAEAENTCMEVKELLLKGKAHFNTSEKAREIVEITDEVLRGLGKDEQANHFQDEIIASFRDLQNNEEMGDTFTETLLEFADLNMSKKQWGNAEKYLLEAYKQDKHNISIIIKLADVYVKENKYDDAIVLYNKTFTICLGSTNTAPRRRDFSFEELFEKTITCLIACGREDVIDDYYQLAIAKLKIDAFTNDPKSTRVGNIYEMYADWLFEQQRYNDSLKYLKECLRLSTIMGNKSKADTNIFRVNCKVACVYHKISLTEKAKSSIHAAIDTHKNNGTKNTSWTRIFYNSIKKTQSYGYQEGADMIKDYFIDAFKDISLENQEAQSSYCTCFGWYLLLLEEYKYAQKPLEEALSIGTELMKNKASVANAKNNLGRLYLHIGKFIEAENLLNDAIEYFKKASAKNDNYLHGYAEGVSYLGKMYLEQGKYPAAISLFEQSLEDYHKVSIITSRYDHDAKEVETWLELAKAKQDNI